VVGVGRPKIAKDDPSDNLYFYTAGLCWKQGRSPYDAKILMGSGRGITDIKDSGIAYPPQSSSLFVLLALFSPSGGGAVWTLLNLASLAALAWLCAVPFRRPPAAPDAEPWIDPRWLIAALVVGNPFPSHVLWKGGSSLVAAALLAGAWACAERDRWKLGGLLLGLATFKPQLALLPILWLLLERRWKILAAGFVAALLFSLPAFRANGVVGAYMEWLGGMKYAVQQKGGAALSEMELRRFLGIVGLPLPDLLLLAPVAAVGLWMARARIVIPDRFPLLIGIAFQFIYLHDGDLVTLSPIIPAYYRHLAGRPRRWTLLALALAAIVCFPQRLLRRPGIELLPFIRIPAVTALVVWLLFLSLEETSAAPPRMAPAEPARA